MENELNQFEQSWMDEQTLLMNAFSQIGQIVMIGGFVLMAIMLAVAILLPGVKESDSEPGVTLQPKSLLTSIYQRPGLSATVLRVVALIVCLLVAVQA